MAVTDWINIPDCPIQRDTEKHAKRARSAHLKKPSPAHQRVAMARMDDGFVCKLDGHTRSLLWQEGSLQPVNGKVYVDVYDCKSKCEIAELYKTFDNPSATETAKDRVYGAYRLHGFTPQSNLIKSGGITSAIKICTNTKINAENIYDSITPFIKPLELIDKEMFSLYQFPAGLLAAMMTTTYIYKEQALMFWRRYYNDQGLKHNNKKDGVQALVEAAIIYHGPVGQSSNWRVRIELCSVGLAAFMAFAENQYIEGRIKPLDLNDFMTSYAPELWQDASRRKRLY